MPDTGYIQVHAYTSQARLPLADVAIAVTAPDGTAIALRLTDRSGRIDPIAVPVPDRSLSQSPNQIRLQSLNLSLSRPQGAPSMEK